MSENNLFQLAQVITDLPMHQDTTMTESPPAPLPRPNQLHHPLMPRKNACIVCAVCFTCSGYYGMNCNCCEAQPRRGKNLPQGGLDSRAKKLNPDDKDDYEFTLKWLDEFTNPIYRKGNDLTEVSLCKAHSSTLYRAKKRHERMKAPPSPADSERRASSADIYPVLPHPYSPPKSMLAEKVREITSRSQEIPDFSTMTASTSMKRKRDIHQSASTPLYAPNRPPDHFSLPPLLNNVNSLSSSLQHQLHLTSIETVSLKSHFTKEYYIRNLVITDNYTFKDLLDEIDFTGELPEGKRIVISDASHEKIYPMNQAIRNVIRYPNDSHLELVLDLAEKASIDWSKYT